MLSAQRHYSLARRGVSDGGAPSTQLSSWDRSMELFQVDVGLQRQHTYSQLTAVCGATRRLMPILFRPNRGSTQFPANFWFFIHITQHLQHSGILVLLTLTLHNNFLFGSIGALCQKWCFSVLCLICLPFSWLILTFLYLSCHFFDIMILSQIEIGRLSKIHGLKFSWKWLKSGTLSSISTIFFEFGIFETISNWFERSKSTMLTNFYK